MGQYFEVLTHGWWEMSLAFGSRSAGSGSAQPALLAINGQTLNFAMYDYVYVRKLSARKNQNRPPKPPNKTKKWRHALKRLRHYLEYSCVYLLVQLAPADSLIHFQEFLRSYSVCGSERQGDRDERQSSTWTDHGSANVQHDCLDLGKKKLRWWWTSIVQDRETKGSSSSHRIGDNEAA